MILYMFISTNISFQSKDIIKIKLGSLKLHVIQDWVWEGQQAHLSQVFFLVLVWEMFSVCYWMHQLTWKSKIASLSTDVTQWVLTRLILSSKKGRMKGQQKLTWSDLSFSQNLKEIGVGCHQAVFCSQHTGGKICHPEGPWQAWKVGPCKHHGVQQGSV